MGLHFEKNMQDACYRMLGPQWGIDQRHLTENLDLWLVGSSNPQLCQEFFNPRLRKKTRAPSVRVIVICSANILVNGATLINVSILH